MGIRFSHFLGFVWINKKNLSKSMYGKDMDIPMEFHPILHEMGKKISNFFKNPRAGKDMVFHRIFPSYGNLYIPRHWGLHEF